MSTFSVRISSRLKRALRKSARAAGNSTTISDVIRDAVTRYVADGGSLQKAAATERARQYTMSATDVEELREILRIEAQMEVHQGLAKRVEKAVAKAIASLDGGAGRYAGSAIDGYVPRPADQRPNGGYAAGNEDSGGTFNESSVEKSEDSSNGWHPDAGRGEDDSDLEANPMSKENRALLRTLGVDTRGSSRKLKKSTDVNPTQSFTVSSNEFVPERSAGYKTSADYAGGERLPAPFKVAGQLMENEYFNKRLTEEGGRTPEALNQLAKSIAAGSGMDGDEYAKTIAGMFGTLKKA